MIGCLYLAALAPSADTPPPTLASVHAETMMTMTTKRRSTRRAVIHSSRHARSFSRSACPFLSPLHLLYPPSPPHLISRSLPLSPSPLSPSPTLGVRATPRTPFEALPPTLSCSPLNSFPLASKFVTVEGGREGSGGSDNPRWRPCRGPVFRSYG